MAQTGSVFTHPSQFDDFLYASIGEDDHGMLVSVLSTWARMGLDPWQEAANLAQLPAEAAAEKLAALLAVLPQGSVAYLDPPAVAARLTGLLPRRTKANAPPGRTPLGIQSRTLPPAIVAVFFFMAIMLFAHYAFQGSR
jgi:hypothetical protein